ncbi:MAG: trypsin-like peptidase domain-containing protein [Clostridia bacterium]|nr:trypsin-like peptidase domain-containing protein [Clostridia bacterium]
MTDFKNEWESDSSTPAPQGSDEVPTAPETFGEDVSHPAATEGSTAWVTPDPAQQPVAPAPVQPSTAQTPPVQPPTAQTPPVQPQPPVQPPYYRAPQNSAGQPPYYRPQPQPPQPPRKKKSGTSVLIAVLAVLCCISLAVSGVLIAKLASQPSTSSGTQQTDPTEDVSTQTTKRVNENAPTLEISGSDEYNDGGLSTREIVANNLDSTVVLTMYTRQTMGFYYGYDFGNNTSEELVKSNAASGIVLSEDGYIITNSHCVYDEDTDTEYPRIDVTFYDGTICENAEIIGYDQTTDLAVIKVNATGLKAATFGDSSALALGDRVITLGNSGGLSWSAAQGILSGQARDVYEDTGYAIKCLQVDATINPGSSGGPLLNAYGQVVGINSAKIVLNGYEDLGFSIPINEAKSIIDDLVKYGYATGRVSLGITGRTVTSLGYEGFMIETIDSNSSLLKTEAQRGDIITHVNGVRVTDYATMRAELVKNKVGDAVTLTLLRYNAQLGKSTTLTVKVQLMESTD